MSLASPSAATQKYRALVLIQDVEYPHMCLYGMCATLGITGAMAAAPLTLRAPRNAQVCSPATDCNRSERPFQRSLAVRVRSSIPSSAAASPDSKRAAKSDKPSVRPHNFGHRRTCRSVDSIRFLGTSAAGSRRVSMAAVGTEATSEPDRSGGGGSVLRQVLSSQDRIKLDMSSDREFYEYPRFVQHVDDSRDNLTKLYRERIRPGSEVFDLMSSWVSHLPKEVSYKRVVGHGLNAQELGRNPRLHQFFVKDLNEDPSFEMADQSFDAVICAVSVQYMRQPEKVFSEMYRILRPGGFCIMSFSSRMFYTKAIATWRDSSAYGRIQLVKQYFQCIRGFTEGEVVKKLSQEDGQDTGFVKKLLKLPLAAFGVRQGGDPFYAVIAYRNFKPI